MEIIDYSNKFEMPINNGAMQSHAEIFPKHIFCIIAGATGSGKTNLMVNLLLQENMINYGDVHIYSSTLHQPAYVYLKSRYEMFERLIQNKTNKSIKLAYFYSNDSELIDPTKLNKDQSYILLFDDLMLTDQTTIKKSSIWLIVTGPRWGQSRLEVNVRSRSRCVVTAACMVLHLSETGYTLPSLLRSKTNPK